MHRRSVLIGAASTLAVATLPLSLRAATPKVWPHHMLSEAWDLTPAGMSVPDMYWTLRNRFGPFPLTFYGPVKNTDGTAEMIVYGVIDDPSYYNDRWRFYTYKNDRPPGYFSTHFRLSGTDSAGRWIEYSHYRKGTEKYHLYEPII